MDIGSRLASEAAERTTSSRCAGAVAAIDEATLYWLNNDQPFPEETMVESQDDLLTVNIDQIPLLKDAMGA
jgi:hypothetical protein